MVDAINIIVVTANGPLIARGDIRIEDASGSLLAKGDEFTLCRCGGSRVKPFCDGTHRTCGFVDPGVVRDDKAEPVESARCLLITVRSHAMLIAKGPMLIQDSRGEMSTTRNKAALCRCGKSKNKPFCDASHKNAGFSAN
jgi:CDGSH-type Zn-finger protein